MSRGPLRGETAPEQDQDSQKRDVRQIGPDADSVDRMRAGGTTSRGVYFLCPPGPGRTEKNPFPEGQGNGVRDILGHICLLSQLWTLFEAPQC